MGLKKHTEKEEEEAVYGVLAVGIILCDVELLILQ